MTNERRPESVHQPVMVKEILQFLEIAAGALVLDGTLGGGGHARRMAEAAGPNGRVIGLDRDGQAIAAAERHLTGTNIQPIHASYVNLPEVCEQFALPPFDAVLLDLGLSSDQLADPERGFSFRAEGVLDMRFDEGRGDPAWQLLARLSEKEIADLLYVYGEERKSRRIAHAIVARRRDKPIRTAVELASLVARVMPPSKNRRIHPATRTFQALRIAVNNELDLLHRALRRIPTCMRPGGRLAVLSYHSLEDRIVKNAFREISQFDIITRKPVRPTDDEVSQNSRSRSACLRVAAIVDGASVSRLG